MLEYCLAIVSQVASTLGFPGFFYLLRDQISSWPGTFQAGYAGSPENPGDLPGSGSG